MSESPDSYTPTSRRPIAGVFRKLAAENRPAEAGSYD